MFSGTPFSRQVTVLSSAGARAVLDSAIASAAARGIQMCVAIVDCAGTLQAFHRMDNAPAVAVDVSVGKARAAAQLGAPSKIFHDMIDGGMPSLLSVPGIIPLRGGLPLVSQGSVVGAIGCSGGSAEQDEEVADAGASALSVEIT